MGHLMRQRLHDSARATAAADRAIQPRHESLARLGEHYAPNPTIEAKWQEALGNTGAVMGYTAVQGLRTAGANKLVLRDRYCIRTNGRYRSKLFAKGSLHQSLQIPACLRRIIARALCPSPERTRTMRVYTSVISPAS
jgi:hypothetical protein